MCYPLSCFWLGSFAGLRVKHDYLENFLTFIARFYALPLDLTDFSKPHVQSNSTPSTSLILQPLEYTTLLYYSHIPNIHRKTSHTRSTTTPKYTLSHRLVLFYGLTPLMHQNVFLNGAQSPLAYHRGPN